MKPFLFSTISIFRSLDYWSSMLTYSLADFLRILMLIISTASENAIAK